MPIQNKKFKTAIVKFTTPVLADFSCQMLAMMPQNNSPDGDKYYTFCSDGLGEGREETDPDWSVTLRGKHDWTATGVSRYLTSNDNAEVELVLNFDNGVAGWNRTWTGKVLVRAPGDGGDARSPQEFEVTLQYVAKPVLTYAI